MRVLFTNNSLDNRAGTELFVRDLAIELLRRGHQPITYSTRLGAVSSELQAAGVPVISNLDALTETPDIIHGQHHYETLTACLRFPAAPAIYFCHGAIVWQEAPLHLPSILRYAAVDQPCRERLVSEGGIPEERIELILNFFDERRFPPRPPLPPQPRKALAYGNAFTEGLELPALREACRRSGIKLDVVGLAVGCSSAEPGPLLAGYDIVFAKARAAIEAMAVGAAVVLCGYGNSGPMVTCRNFASLRLLNFGLKALTIPVDPDTLDAELGRYDPGDAAQVSALTRGECGLQPAVDRMLQLYSRVIEEARRLPPTSPEDLCRAAARYLEQWAPDFKRGFEHDPALACAERELIAVRASATWRWSQRVLANPVVRAIFGPLIRAAARRSNERPASSSLRT